MLKKAAFLKSLVIFVCALLLSLSACSFLNKPLKSELIEYTEKAAFGSTDFESLLPRDQDGILSIPSSFTGELLFFLRNPQQYLFEISDEFSADYDIAAAAFMSSGGDITHELAQKDATTLAIRFNPDFLETIDGGTDINPLLAIIELKSRRTFGPYGIPLRANSVPAPVSNATILQDISANEYIICFNMPDMSGIHKDITRLDINGSSFDVSLSQNPSSAETGLTAGGGILLTFDDDANWQPVPPSGGRNFDAVNREAAKRPVYYRTGITPSAGDKDFSITLGDRKGLSKTVTATTRAQKLEPPTAAPRSGSTLLQNADGCGEVVLNAPSAQSSAEIHFTAISAAGLSLPAGSGSGSTLLKLPPGVWTIRAYATKPGFVNSDEVSFTYTVNLADLYVRSNGSDSSGDGSTLRPYASIRKAAAVIESVNDGSSYYAINVMDDLTSDPAAYDSSHNQAFINLAPTRNLNLTIKSNAAGVNRAFNANRGPGREGRVMYIGGKANVTLQDVSLSGGYTADNGGGVYVGGGLAVAGKVVITGNTKGVDANNVYLPDGKTITVAGRLDSASRIGVSVYNTLPYTFTAGYGINGNGTPAACFTADNASHAVRTIGSGGAMEVQLSVSLTNVYLNGDTGDDTKNGTDAANAVATFDTAQSLLADGGTILICGTIDITTPQLWDLTGRSATLKRNPGFTGALIRVGTGGSLTLTGITVDGNKGVVTNADNPLVLVENGGSLSLGTNTILQNNRNSGSGGAIQVSGSSSRVTMNSNSKVIMNYAGSDGGGIHADTGATIMLDNNATIGGSGNANTAYMNGGGICIKGGTLTIAGSAAIDNNTAAYGGGLSIQSGTGVNMSGGYIRSNSAGQWGGGVRMFGTSSSFSLQGGTISNNTMALNPSVEAVYGGGVCIQEGVFSLKGAPTISGNKRGTLASGTDSNVYLATGILVTVTGELSNTQKIGISMKTPGLFTSGYGYGSVNRSDPAARFRSDDGTLITLSGTEAQILPTSGSNTITLANTISVNVGETITIAPPAGSTTTIKAPPAIDMALFNVTAGGKLVLGGGGGTVIIDGSETAGNVFGTEALVKVGFAGTVEIKDGVRLQNNRLNNGNGGGVQISGGVLTMSGGTISGCEARRVTADNWGGGGVYMTGGTFNLTGGKIENNTARMGGAVFMSGGTFNMSGGEITGNTAQGNGDNFGGGAVHVFEGTFVLTKGSITGNTVTSGTGAATPGGGIRIRSPALFIYDTTNPDVIISGNTTFSSNYGNQYFISAGVRFGPTEASASVLATDMKRE